MADQAFVDRRNYTSTFAVVYLSGKRVGTEGQAGRRAVVAIPEFPEMLPLLLLLLLLLQLLGHACVLEAMARNGCSTEPGAFGHGRLSGSAD